jgi:hypothetical protein
VHRDVKPGNLLVRPNGTLVLTDFGIARSALVGQLTVAGSVLGTASYISPEQASGEVATAASDVYALGVVAYQCLSGHRPFDGATPIEIAMKHVRETPRPLPADIPPPVRAIVDRALAKNPGARWPTAAAMAAVARQAASSLTTPSQQPAVNGPPAARSPARRRPHRSGDRPAGARPPVAGPVRPGRRTRRCRARLRRSGARRRLGAAGAAVPAPVRAADAAAAAGRPSRRARRPAGADRAGRGARTAGPAVRGRHLVPVQAGQQRGAWPASGVARTGVADRNVGGVVPSYEAGCAQPA